MPTKHAGNVCQQFPPTTPPMTDTNNGRQQQTPTTEATNGTPRTHATSNRPCTQECKCHQRMPMEDAMNVRQERTLTAYTTPTTYATHAKNARQWRAPTTATACAHGVHVYGPCVRLQRASTDCDGCARQIRRTDTKLIGLNTGWMEK